MNTRWITISSLFAASLGLALTGCKELECAEGTVEADGMCKPSNGMFSNAMCGPFTVLQGDKCVPMFPPTECDPTTTEVDVDPATGVTTCIGTGGGGCASPLPCPAPSAGKQTICGQLYNLEDNEKYAQMTPAPSGAKCTPGGATDGPCALSITAYDAIQFGTNPMTAVPLAVGDVYLDDCGRYRVTDITPPAGPFVGLGIDDFTTGNRGPAGVTNTVGVAIPKQISMATKDFEAWIAKKSTTDMWTSSGGPPISGGYYVNIFRARHEGLENQAGVTATKGGQPNTANDYYFAPAETARRTIMAGASVTGANGTAIITNAAVSEGPAYAGSGQIPAECIWEAHAGASIPNIVFVQLFRPGNAIGQTCPL
ncbi:MAG: hypothetical protein JNL83_33390 [Myxococcales bacterium]|nr:hypothetical protein [Myxococcales bacterium]